MNDGMSDGICPKNTYQVHETFCAEFFDWQNQSIKVESKKLFLDYVRIARFGLQSKKAVFD